MRNKYCIFLLPFLPYLIIACGKTKNSPITQSNTETPNSETAQIFYAKTSKGAKFVLNHQNFYNSMNPHPSSSCAGDVKNIFDPFLGSTDEYGYLQPTAFIASDYQSNESTKPLFIKNVSVDLTDSSSEDSDNRAKACSIGKAKQSALSDFCAAFDASSLGGSTQAHSGTILTYGGTHQANSNCLNESCTGSFFQLQLNRYSTQETKKYFPHLSGELSIIENISSKDGYMGPIRNQAASFYDAYTQSFYLFGGFSQFLMNDKDLNSRYFSDTNELWSYSLLQKKWNTPFIKAVASPELTMQSGQSKNDFGISQFGYFTQLGEAYSIDDGNIDTELDRIFIIRGIRSGEVSNKLSRMLNPTFGPEFTGTQLDSMPTLVLTGEPSFAGTFSGYTGMTDQNTPFFGEVRYNGNIFGGTKCSNYHLANASGCELKAGLSGMAALSGMAMAKTANYALFYGGSEIKNSSTNCQANCTLSKDSLYRVKDNILIEIANKSGTLPPPLTNAQMVYSHMTEKFYLFGGVNNTVSQQAVNKSVFEISFNESNQSAHFRRLENISCFPKECPKARFNHRMTEVNYAALNNCSIEKPCSHAIFMEGGTDLNQNLFSDRWVFDPTANNNEGHWLQVNTFPPRRNAMLTSVQFKDERTQKTHSFGLLFGGEFSLSGGTAEGKGIRKIGNRFFIPPTLGDTYLIGLNPSQNTDLQWERTQLLGEDRVPANLTPPPLSGAQLITRTHKILNGKSVPLQSTEAYLFGGRKGNGELFPIQNMYKFCVGTNSENTQFECNYYHPTQNPSLIYPPTGLKQKTVGRWLLKAAELPSQSNTTALLTAYHSAATYVSKTDKIVLAGADTQLTLPNLLEYRFPSPEKAGGSWSVISACPSTELPLPRYGHSLSYDAKLDALVMIGGFHPQTHMPFLQSNSNQQNIPEIWSAKPKLEDNQPCYEWKREAHFRNKHEEVWNTRLNLGIGYHQTFYIPQTGESTGYYTLNDSVCETMGPLLSSDPIYSKRYTGGVNIDLDRSQIKPDRKLLMHIKYISKEPLHTNDETPLFKVHLQKINLSLDALLLLPQPRYHSFFESPNFPTIIDTIDILPSTPYGLQERQIIIPLTELNEIDRIRIEKEKGSAILLDVTLHQF